MKYKTGQQFKKVGGDYSFVGTIVSAFTKLNGTVRYVGENKDGLLFIFNEASIEPCDGTRKIIINGREVFTDKFALDYFSLTALAGITDHNTIFTITYHTIGLNDGGTVAPNEAFVFDVASDRVVVFNIVKT